MMKMRGSSVITVIQIIIAIFVYILSKVYSLCKKESASLKRFIKFRGNIARSFLKDLIIFVITSPVMNS